MRKHPVQNLDVEPLALEQRGRGIPVVQSEFPILGLDVALPDLLPIQRETGELAVARHDPDMAAVRYGRRGRGILFPEKPVAGVDLPLPSDRPIFPVYCDQENLVACCIPRNFAVQARSSFLCGGHEDPILPDGGRSRAPARQFRAPKDVL